MSYLIRVVKTSDMPENLFNYIYRVGLLIEDGFTEWVIGDFVKEAKKEPLLYSANELDIIKEIDKWLISQSAKDSEKVLIEHG